MGMARKWAQIIEETGLPRIFDPTQAEQVDEVLGVYGDVKDETYVACYMLGADTDPFDKRRFDIDWDALNIITNVATAQQLYSKLHDKLVEAAALPGEEDVAV